MAKDFDYGALWSIARDALDAVSILTRAMSEGPAPLVAPWAIRNPPPGYHEKWQAELKTLPERRAKMADAIRKAAEKLGKLLAEDRYIAPLAGVWPPRAPEVAHRLSNGLVMAASAARAVIASKDDVHFDQPKRFAVDAQYTLQAVVGELERRPKVAALAYQRQVGKLRAERPDWSGDEALATWQSGDSGNDGDLIERLLAGPDDVELTPRELALLEAHLKQPISLSAIHREKRATGKSETQMKRNKLILIRDFNRNLQAAQSTDIPPPPDVHYNANNKNAIVTEPTAPSRPTTKPKRSNSSDGESSNESSKPTGEPTFMDEWVADIAKTVAVVVGKKYTAGMSRLMDIAKSDEAVDRRLYLMGKTGLLRPDVSARALAALLGCSDAAVKQTRWWKTRMAQRKQARADADAPYYRSRGARGRQHRR